MKRGKGFAQQLLLRENYLNFMKLREYLVFLPELLDYIQKPELGTDM
jgi:hypothetical protein